MNRYKLLLSLLCVRHFCTSHVHDSPPSIHDWSVMVAKVTGAGDQPILRMIYFQKRDLHSENAVSTQAESGWVTSRCTLSQAYTVICTLTWRTPQIIDSSLPILYWSNNCEHLHCLFCTECLALYARRRSHGTEMLHRVMMKLHVLKAWSDYLFANTLV